MGYGLEGPGSIPGSAGLFSSPKRPGRLWGPTQPPIQLVRGALSPEIKRQGREADHSLPSTDEVKKVGATLPHPICLHGIVLN
jgi:hypothetical protein